MHTHTHTYSCFSYTQSFQSSQKLPFFPLVSLIAVGFLVFFMFQLPSAKNNHFQSPSITADTKQLVQVACLSSATAQRSCQQSWRQKSSSSYLMPILHKCKGIEKHTRTKINAGFSLVVMLCIVHYFTILKVDQLQLSTNMMLSFGFRTKTAVKFLSSLTATKGSA